MSASVSFFCRSLLVVITAAVVTYFLPRKYRSSVSMEVRTPQEDQSVFNNGNYHPPSSAMDPQFLSTQTEIIRSHEVLDPVIESEGLSRVTGLVDGSALYPKEACLWETGLHARP